MTNPLGEFHRTSTPILTANNPLISKGSAHFQPIRRRGPTLVYGTPFPEQEKEAEILLASSASRPRPPNARERRASRQKHERHQRQRETFTDAAAYAYFSGYPLELRLTITWGACWDSDPDEGHILALPDKERNERLRDAVWRLLRKHGVPLVCIWSRDECMKRGAHVHLALYWPPSIPVDELVWLLARLTGCRPESGLTQRGLVARAEGGGWQINCNGARDQIRSARDWTDYMRDQGPRHLIRPTIEGKVLGVSAFLSAGRIEAQREELNAWKLRVGWHEASDA